MTRQTTVREAVFELLRAFGMTTVFGNPGSTELPMFRDFPADFRYVLALQESIARRHGGRLRPGHAATRRWSTCTPRPASATRSAISSPRTATSTPLVVIAGQQARSILPFEPFLYAQAGDRVPEALCEVELRAGARRGRAGGDRARLSTRDAGAARARPSSRCRSTTGTGCASRSRRAQRQPRRARRSAVACGSAEALNRAERPVIVVGASSRRATTPGTETIALAERHQAPVWVSPMSRRNSFPEDHPLFAGFLAADRSGSSPTSPATISSSCSARRCSPIMSKDSGRTCPPGADAVQLIDDPAHGRFGRRSARRSSAA